MPTLSGTAPLGPGEWLWTITPPIPGLHLIHFDGSGLIEAGDPPDCPSGTYSQYVLKLEVPLVSDHEVERPLYLPVLPDDSEAIADLSVTEPDDVFNEATCQVLTDLMLTDPLTGVVMTIFADTKLTWSDGTCTGIDEVRIGSLNPDNTPSALPSTSRPHIVVTIQPPGMILDTPAAITFPGNGLYASGNEMTLVSVDEDTGSFVGRGPMDIAGDAIVPQSGATGITKTGWHFPLPLGSNGVGGDASCCDSSCCSSSGGSGGGGGPSGPVGGDTASGGSTSHDGGAAEPTSSVVMTRSGELMLDYQLPTHRSMGVSRGVSLSYSSQAAIARPLVRGDFFVSTLAAVPKLMGFQLQVGGDVSTEDELFYDTFPPTIPESGSEEHEFRIGLPYDASEVMTGVYGYALTASAYYFTTSLYEEPWSKQSSIIPGKLTVVNHHESPFGAGWGVAQLQELWPQPDGSVLITDGTGGSALYEAPSQLGIDLIHACEGTTFAGPEARRRMGDETSGFAYGPSSALGPCGRHGPGIALGDLDNDGVVDLVGSAHNSGQLGHRGTGAPVSQEPRLISDLIQLSVEVSHESRASRSGSSAGVPSRSVCSNRLHCRAPSG